MNTKFSIVVLFFSVLMLWSCDSKTSSNQTEGNSSNPDDELVEIEEEYEDDCEECNGTGYVYYSCSSCGGTGQKYHYSTETRRKECYNCYGAGYIRCQKCGAKGYIECEYCGGNGSSQCSVCHGYGIIVYDRNDPDTWVRCNSCKGTGYADCLMCGGKGRMECSPTETCPVCWVSGYYGQENVSNSGYVTCGECNGSGRYRSWCDVCNGSGRVIKTRVIQKKKSEL